MSRRHGHRVGDDPLPRRPECVPYSQKLEFTVTCAGDEATATGLAITAASVRGKDAAGAEVRRELPGTSFETAETLEVVPDGGAVHVVAGLAGDAITNERLGVLCGLAEPTLELGLAACGGTTTVSWPLTVTCYPDRRAGAFVDLDDAGTPADLPCARRTGSSPNDPGAVDYRLGYDAAGRHTFTDKLFGSTFASRVAYRYDDDDRVLAIVEVDPETRLSSYQAFYTRDASGRVVDAIVEVTPLGGEEAEWRGRYAWSYPGGADQGWTVTRDGVASSSGVFDAAENELAESDEDSIEVAAGFEVPFERETWLVSSDVARLHALRPTRLSLSNLEDTMERRITWSEGRIESDVTTINGLSFTSVWDYDCE